MKNLALILILIIPISINAQKRTDCTTPISNFEFSQRIAVLSAKQGDAQKLNTAKNIALNNCLSTEQVKKIAESFQDDYNRLAFVQAAYNNTTDKDNFYEVYNSFTYFSTVFRLHDFVAEQKKGKGTSVINRNDHQMSFPDLQYPNFRTYYGKTGCKNLMSDDDFMKIANNVFNQKDENKKITLTNNYLYTKCFTTEQVMKITSLFQNEQSRTNFLKKAYKKVYDPGNYEHTLQLLKNNNYRQQVKNLYSSNNSVGGNDIPCEVKADDFANVKNRINRESFTNSKINLAKQIIKNKKCFKSTQVVELVRLFRYSDAQMDIAKFTYDYTTDKNNYHIVADVFSFRSDKEKLLKFIEQKQN